MKIYKITEASEYLGVLINTLKMGLANLMELKELTERVSESSKPICGYSTDPKGKT